MKKILRIIKNDKTLLLREIILITITILYTLDIFDINVKEIKRQHTWFYIVFLADYILFFLIDDDKIKYLKDNWLLAISLIPFEYIPVVRIFRITRVTRIIRVVAFHKSFLDKRKDIETNSLIMKILYNDLIHNIIGFAFVNMIVISILLRDIEPKTFPNIYENMWYFIVTISTVGYGDIAPITWAGRIIGVYVIFLGLFSVSGIIAKSSEIAANKSKNSYDSDFKRETDEIDVRIDELYKHIENIEKQNELILKKLEKI